MKLTCVRWAWLIAIVLAASTNAAEPAADDADTAKDRQEEKGEDFEIAGGNFKLTAPANWEAKEPAVSIIEHEFKVPESEGDEMPGRVTVMNAGGGVQANLDRWYSQFKQPDGSDTKELAGEPEKMTIAGQEIILVDISGTYVDKPPRAARGIDRPHYRLLGAIISTEEHGDYFIKFYGPEKTVTDNEEAFEKMLEGLTVN